jgi:hypothetical protein
MKIAFPIGQDIDEWQVFLWNLPDDVVARPQKLQFMMMLEAGFNQFDPYVVVRDLLRHRDLWQGVLMDRGFVSAGDRSLTMLSSDLIKLRDIGSSWNVDTLYVTTHESESVWEPLVENWQADEISWIEAKQASDLLGSSIRSGGPRILTVWWD